MTTAEYRRLKDRSANRAIWLFNGVAFSCLLLLLGPCSVEQVSDNAMLDIKSDIERCMSYGDSIDWDGKGPYRHSCTFDGCFY